MGLVKKPEDWNIRPLRGFSTCREENTPSDAEAGLIESEAVVRLAFESRGKLGECEHGNKTE